MKYAIIYSSLTGNTGYLAKAIEAELKSEDAVIWKTGGTENTEIIENIKADLYFVGFWTNRGTCDKDTENLLRGLRNTQVFLFGTAGFGGSPSYCKKIMNNVQNIPDSSVKVAGTFMCQGRLPFRIKEKYEKMAGSIFTRYYARYMLKNFDKALKHPNQEDVRRLLSALESVLTD